MTCQSDGELECGELFMGNSLEVFLNECNAGGDYINDATVTLTLKDKLGVAVVGANGLTMTFTSTPGQYRGVLPHTLALTKLEKYTVVVNAVKAGTGVGEWEVERTAKKRGRC